MGIDENKEVVRQYLTGIHAAPPDLAVFDELLAPSYQGDRAAQSASAAAVHDSVREQTFDIAELIAEGDTVVARFKYRATLRDGSDVQARGYCHCRFDDGKIVAQHVMTNPDMTSVLALLLAPLQGPDRATPEAGPR